MTKVAIRTLDSVTNNDTTATQLINENFQALQTAIENTLSRDGTTPNFMDANLDLNSYKIINAGTPTDNTDVITKEYFDQNVGDAAGYAAAAASSAQQASTFAGSANSYATVATGAANIAQAARDYIESDPGFITVSTDLLLGEDSSIKKTSDDLTNIDTVAGSIANVNAVGTDIANVNSVAGDLTNIDAVNANKTNIDAVAGNNANITAVANNATNINAVNANKTNIDTVATNITDVNSVAGDIAKVTAVADDLTNIDAVNANKTNIDAVAGNNSNITAVANNETNINAVNANKTNIDAVVANATNINTVAGDITNINAVAADLVNIDAASGYAAEAKQWAIGDPTEPVDGSAKYWAQQSAASQVQADWLESNASAKGYIRNKPTAGDNISLSNNEISAVSDASPTLSSTKLVQSGGVYTGLNNLQTQIDAIVASSDVFDIVGTYAELQAYDITTVPVNDIVKVLVDETHSGAATYYRCVESGDVKSWSYIGAEGAYYTKGEADVLLAGRANRDLSNLSVTGQAVLDAKQDVATAVNYDNITNCITEIPQDIKLELNNGTLTLKAGSKVYVPNGFESDGTTPKFDTVILQNDKIYNTVTSTTGRSMFFLYPSLNIGAYTAPDDATITYYFSGPTAPTVTYTYALWYDTANNIVKHTSDNGVTWTSGDSLPLSICSYTSGTGVTSIDQVFNGFGYIGSTVFALPGVKGLIPNGRNADGTLKNIEFTVSQVIIDTLTNNQNYTLCIGGNISQSRYFVSQEEEPTSNYTLWYKPSENIMYRKSGSGVVSVNGGISYCNVTVGNSGITSFTPKTAFHAVDYNDVVLQSSLAETLIDTLYPVGSVYIGTTANCPLAAIKGTWTLQGSGIVTSINSNVPIKGDGKALGISNGTTEYGLVNRYNGTAGGRLLGSTNATGKNVGTTQSAGGYNTTEMQVVGISTDATKSHISGTVTSSSYTVNIWERTA